MSRTLQTLIELARRLQRPLAFEELLQRIVDSAAELLEVEHASIRLLDPGRTRLIAMARAGAPVHENPNTEFRVGEGLNGWVVAHGEPLVTGDAMNDPRFAERPGMRVRFRSFIGVPLVSGNTSLGLISAVSETPDYFSDEHVERLMLLAAMSAPHAEVARLSRLATVDPLTGALNRRGLDSTFPDGDEADVVRPLSIALVDIDRFKSVNDDHGHAVGDRVLQHVARVLGAAIREGDAVIRFGGEEFLLLLPRVDINTAMRIVERARARLMRVPPQFDDAALQITFSAGVAELARGESRSDVIARADDALHRAKASGRNRVEAAANPVGAAPN